MGVEYWLIDSESGNAQGCYLSLDDALLAAEVEAQGPAPQPLSLLGMRSPERVSHGEREPQPAQRLFVRFDLGVTLKDV